ncbi:MAG: hypothetical protein JZU55_02705 [Afipia sp.]|jgi:hypothetical protein|nr:hypothetical protein [Afipia sp.]
MLSDAQIALKAATRRAVKMAGGSVAASKDLRVDQGRLSNYGNADGPLYAPIDVAFDLDRLAGDNVILRAWADLCGFDLSPRDASGAASHDLTVAAGQVARESGELISATIEAAADGKVTPNEARAIDEAAADLQEKVVDIREAARRSMVARS